MSSIDDLEDRIEDLETKMADNQATPIGDGILTTLEGNGTPLPHDGFSSRSYIYGCAVTLILLIGSFAALFVTVGATGKEHQVATFPEVASFLQIAIPAVAIITLGKMGWDKKLERDVRK